LISLEAAAAAVAEYLSVTTPQQKAELVQKLITAIVARGRAVDAADIEGSGAVRPFFESSVCGTRTDSNPPIPGTIDALDWYAAR
jgi:hypothetical protein